MDTTNKNSVNGYQAGLFFAHISRTHSTFLIFNFKNVIPNWDTCLKGFVELTWYPSLTGAVSFSSAETTKDPNCSQVKKNHIYTNFGQPKDPFRTNLKRVLLVISISSLFRFKIERKIDLPYPQCLHTTTQQSFYLCCTR